MTILAMIIALLTYLKQWINNNAYIPKIILLALLFSKNYFNISPTRVVIVRLWH